MDKQAKLRYPEQFNLSKDLSIFEKTRNFLTHSEIARLTATSRQTVTTKLNKLRRKGIVDYNEKHLKIIESDMHWR